MTVSTGPVPRPELTGLAAYSAVAPGPVPVRVRASSTEAPGGLAGPVLDAAVAAVGGASRYPLIGGGALAAALASSLGVAADAVAVAAGALPLRDRRLRVPRDISVIGFDDILVGKYLEPPLTTVHLPAVDLGRRAGDMILRIIHGETLDAMSVRLPTHLVIRRSTAAVEAQKGV